MAKAGMRRPDPKAPHGTESNHISHFPKNEVPPVPEIQGKAKHGNAKVRPIIAGTASPEMKVYHSHPHSDKPISGAYAAIDNDLARDNLENDLTAADQQDT